MNDDQKICSLCSAWIDQELCDSARNEFELHLNHCDECRLKIERWRNFEHELVAACSLFGASKQANDLVDNLVNAESFDESLATKTPSSQSKSRTSHWRSRDFRKWTVAATLISASILGWIALGKPGSFLRDDESSAIEKPSIAEGVPTDSDRQMPRAHPVVHITVQEPVIASAPVTTPRFTVINVYPVFLDDPSEQTH